MRKRKVGNSRKRPAPVRSGTDGLSIGQLQLEEFKKSFPVEVKAICELLPLQQRPEIADGLLSRLSEIVHYARTRAAPSYRENIRTFVESSVRVAAEIQTIAEGIAKLDLEHLEAFFSLAEELAPYFKGKSLEDLLGDLAELRTVLLAIGPAAQIGTATVVSARRRGRPQSPHVESAWQLIEAWESATAERLQEDSPLWMMKRAPTPKRLEGKRSDDVLHTKQPSTAFVWVGLQMITPQITEAEVFTAIKNALKARDEFYEFVRNKPPGSLVGGIQRLMSLREAKKADSRKRR